MRALLKAIRITFFFVIFSPIFDILLSAKTHHKEYPMTNRTFINGEFCWNELITPHPEAAKPFYRDLFGWEFEEFPMLDQAPYTMIKKGETSIGGLMQTPTGQTIPPHWGNYINVENLEKTVDKAQALGGKILVNITSVGDFGRLAVIQDPTGANVSLWQPCKSD